MRVYCPSENIKKNNLSICDREQIHHLLDVLRIKGGDTIYVFDGLKEYECLVSKVDRKLISAKIVRVSKAGFGPKLEIALACAIPKRGRIDYIIEKCTELGVARIMPMVTERTVVRLNQEKIDAKLSRWQRIAEEASKQSGRVVFPVIEPVSDFDKVLLAVKDYDLALLPNLSRENKNIKETLTDFSGKSVIVFVGPEGDFSRKEISLAEKAGCIGVSLGGLVLKVDTAAIALVSLLSLGR